MPDGDGLGVELGTIEGFYGRPWSWEARAEHVRAMAPHGFRFFLYAPKADPYLRRDWREEHPAEAADALARLSGQCRAAGGALRGRHQPLRAVRELRP